MARVANVVLLTVFIALAAGAARANEPGGLVTHVTLGGMDLSCRDFRGQVVRSIRMDDLGDVAHARIVNRMPIITLNQSRLDTLPGKLQVFFFHHECAHHLMGHVFYPTGTSENEADCYAIKVGRREGFFTRLDIQSFAPYLANSRGSMLGHLPGPQRAARLVACFDDPSDENFAEPAGFTYAAPSPPQVAEGVR